MNKLFLSSVLLLLLTACNKFHVDGTSSISVLDGKMISLKVMGDVAPVTVDSCEIVHGKFSFRGKLDSVQMATVFLDDTPILPMVLEKGKIKIAISDVNTTATGTPLNNKLTAFFDQRQTVALRAEELQRKENQMILDGYDPFEIQEALQSDVDALETEMGGIVVDFITSNFDNILGKSIFIMFANSIPYPALTPEIEEILQQAPQSFKNDPYISAFIEVAEENTRRMMEYAAAEEEQ